MNADVGTLKIFDGIDSLLNTDLTELADLADFKVPAAGRYTLNVSAETKEIGTHPAVCLNYEVMGIVELADPESVPPTIGDKFGENYNIDNEYGVGRLKKALQPYAASLNIGNIGELLEALQGIVITGTVKRREDKEKVDDDGNKRVYGSVVNVAVQ